jgi:hypothetical protein
MAIRGLKQKNEYALSCSSPWDPEIGIFRKRRKACSVGSQNPLLLFIINYSILASFNVGPQLYPDILRLEQSSQCRLSGMPRKGKNESRDQSILERALSRCILLPFFEESATQILQVNIRAMSEWTE